MIAETLEENVFELKSINTSSNKNMHQGLGRNTEGNSKLKSLSYKYQTEKATRKEDQIVV